MSINIQKLYCFCFEIMKIKGKPNIINNPVTTLSINTDNDDNINIISNKQSISVYKINIILHNS